MARGELRCGHPLFQLLTSDVPVLSLLAPEPFLKQQCWHSTNEQLIAAVPAKVASIRPDMSPVHVRSCCVDLLTSALSCTQYTTYAWGMDELQPISRRGKNSFAGMGATIVDSLSTLWIMGMKQEFANGTDWVRTELKYPLTRVRCRPLRAVQLLSYECTRARVAQR
jgi:hypothetical protein